MMNERQHIDIEALRQDIRTSIRDELRSSDSTVEQAPVELEQDSRPVDQGEAARQALAVVSTAIDAGDWTSVEREQLRGIIDHLQPEDREHVLQEWALAVNEQRLRPAVPPL
ncbi:MAG: hypothetical protein K8H88_13315 [Sandaracinaceae bacterium]|nr:hypothetical protein [Sandaracinaceae bacterium]